MANGTKIKVEKTDNYTIMSNQHFHVTNMTLKAKGLLSLILSLPNDWDYSVAGLTSLCKESYNTVQTALKELQDLGYLEVKKLNPTKREDGGTGFYEYEYIVYENSKTPEKLQFKFGGKSRPKKQGVDF